MKNIFFGVSLTFNFLFVVVAAYLLFFSGMFFNASSNESETPNNVQELQSSVEGFVEIFGNMPEEDQKIIDAITQACVANGTIKDTGDVLNVGFVKEAKTLYYEDMTTGEQKNCKMD